MATEVSDTKVAEMSLFELFKKEMVKKGIDLNKGGDFGEKSNLLASLEEHIQKDPKPACLAHSDHSSFTRHASHAAKENEDKPSPK